MKDVCLDLIVYIGLIGGVYYSYCEYGNVANVCLEFE